MHCGAFVRQGRIPKTEGCCLVHRLLGDDGNEMNGPSVQITSANCAGQGEQATIQESWKAASKDGKNAKVMGRWV